MRTLVYGKYLIRGAGERRQIVKNGAACVEGSIIKDVGDFKVLSKSYQYDLKVGSEKHIVMPGLINSHDHGNGIGLILRGISDGPLETWVQDFFYRGMEGWNTYDNVMLSCINQIKKTAKRLKTGIHTHLVETRYQAQYGTKFLGKTPAKHLDDLAILGPEVSCAHSIWLTREDISILAKTRATAVHNPSSNLRLFNGIAPALEMKRAGMSVAIGLDGTTINDEQDMFQEMRLCSLLQRHPGIQARHLSPNEILDMNLTGASNVALDEGRICDIG